MMLHIRPLLLVVMASLGASACDHTRIADESHETTQISFRPAPPPPDRSSLPGFLRVSSGGFSIDAAPFTLLGANAWNLTKPGMTQAAIRDVLEKAATYGFNTVRTWAYREFEDPGFTNFDLVLSEAQRAGLKVIFVLTDNWNHFPSVSTPYGPLGGADAFVFECAGEISAPKGNADPLTHEMFFTEDCPRRKYQEWVETVVPRYRDNPSLAAWELINEPRCSGTDQTGGLPTKGKTWLPWDVSCAKAIEEWVDHFSRFLAGLDRNHLISVGDEGYPRRETQVGVSAEAASTLPAVHFLNLHYYLKQKRKLTYGQTVQEMGRVATRVQKPFVVSEFGIPSSAGRACQYSAWIGELSKVAGSGGWLFWQLMDPSSSDSDEYAELGWNPAIGVLSQAARAGSAGSILELDCRVEGLTVKVSEEGSNIPVANATVELWPGTDQNFLPIAVMTTDASGSVSQFGLVPGEYTLAVEALGYQGPETAVVHIRHASSNVFAVILKSNEVKGDLGGIVRNTMTNTPIFGATVELWAGSNNTTGTPLAQTQSDAAGHYQFPSLIAGTYTIRAHASGFQEAVEPSVVVQASASNVQDLSLSPLLPPPPSGLGIGFGGEQFALIPAGTFEMGSTNGFANEQPVHTVTLTKPFMMQRTEVTQAQWRQVIDTSPSARPACGDTCPVEMVSWYDIQLFLTALNQQDPGKGYRLPTEAEWEYAARAGTTGDYNVPGQLVEALGWINTNSQNKTWPVAQKLPNVWGLYDMHGNIREWVADVYSNTYYSVSPSQDPPGPATGTNRALRGGSYFDGASLARSASRYTLLPQNRLTNVGFRLARTP